MFLIALYGTAFLGWVGYLLYQDVKETSPLTPTEVALDVLIGGGIACALVGSITLFF